MAIDPKITNLKQVRKDRARNEARAKATENAAKFGQSKAAKTLHQRESAKTEAALDGHLRVTPFKPRGS